jgi:glycyl-tRNA synthetase beta chain
MGRYYALQLYYAPELAAEKVHGTYQMRSSAEDQIAADAIRDHYKPLGPSDAVPTEPVAAAVALADKRDTLAGFFAIGEKPTGSGDPYALRRAALGLIRIILGTGARQPLASWAEADLLAFLLDRLRVLLRDQGRRHDRIEAVLATGDDDIVRIVARLDALDAGLGTDDGANLIAGWKRAANILKAEQKKDAGAGDGAVDPARLREPAERGLNDALAAAVPAVDAAVGAEDFASAMAALAALRQPIDAFFEAVLVNDPDPDIRRNRLALLAAVTHVSRSIADFSKLEG